MKKTCFDNLADFFTAINEWGKFPLSSTTSALLDNVSVKQSSDTYCPEGKQTVEQYGNEKDRNVPGLHRFLYAAMQTAGLKLYKQHG